MKFNIAFKKMKLNTNSLNVSFFGILFSSMLINWANAYNVITDAQFGFQPNIGTAEAIFCLSSIINMSLRNKKRLYCCFIDFKKAFDTVERFKLWQKLDMYGIRGKFLNVIRSMYDDKKSCIKTTRMLSDVFENSLGLVQGQVLSPNLFSFYVNDLEMQFIQNGNVPLQVQELNLFTLTYVDDMVCFAESVHEIQLMLYTLYDYTAKWDLAINTDKTKIVNIYIYKYSI